MSELKLYEISEEYISYISTVEKNVFSSKGNDRNHTRKYLGIVYSINGYNYYIPLSSPKNSDYRMENGVQKIRGSIVPIIRITSQSSSGELELKGTLKLSNMIPVPVSELTLYDIEHEPDLFYKALIHKEMLFIRKNKNKIIQNAKILYKQKKENNPVIGYLKSTVDFSLLEQMYDKFIEKEKINHQTILRTGCHKGHSAFFFSPVKRQKPCLSAGFPKHFLSVLKTCTGLRFHCAPRHSTGSFITILIKLCSSFVCATG